MRCQVSISRRAEDGRYTATCATHPHATYQSHSFNDVMNWADAHRADTQPFPWREELPMITFMALTTLGLLALGLLAVFI